MTRIGRFIRTHRLVITPLILFFLLTVGIFFFNLVIVDYIDGFRVMVKGREIGLIKNRGDVAARLAILKRRIETEKSIEIVFDGDLISFEPTEATLDRFTSMARLDEALRRNVTYKCKVWALRIANADSVYLRTDGEIDELIRRLKAAFIPRARSDERIENLQVKIREAYSAEKGLAYFEDIRDVDEAFRYVLWGAQKIEKYTIKPGDTFYLISQKYRLAFSDLLAANPDLDPQHLKAGDVVSLTVPKPLFNVEVSYRHVYEQIIFPPVVVNMDRNMLRTQLKVDEPGAQGRKRVYADTVRVNEREQSVNVVKEEILKNPLVRILRIGTQRTPDDILVAGAFLPAGVGVISDYFWTPRPGGRHHLGIDVAIPEGTAVHAYRGGTVTFAGWSPAGYGSLVTIEDENGTVYYYGHNSKLKVTVGQTVAAGEIISLSGNTGVSTGPHVHFEVHVDNKVTDPLKFLKGK
ncbi:MAG: M23 family metallopeptidase [Spirochaetales bacterium]|nr:M23 family metallopeptidase [Spirochaetales bacterium]